MFSPMIRAILFDIDGTLIDTVDFHAEAWQKAFREIGKEIPFQEIRSQIGKGGDQLLPVFLSREELEQHEESLSERRAEIFRESYLARVKPFPGVRELMQRLQRDGKAVVLASSAKGDELQEFKRIAGIDDLIGAETSSDDADKSKPHPDIFLAALERAKVRPEEALAVGDTPYDAEAAGKAGVKTVGVLCGGFPEESLRAAGCVAIYRDPQELLARYGESPLGR
jgi:HAD superfamily hydrolase (TIGR01509 family)